MTGADLPLLLTDVPGPGSRRRVDVLARYECPAVTARRDRRAASLGADDDDPIVWRAALGANVEDVDGNRFVDLTSGFGVAFIGHRHPDVVAAATQQTATLVHAMGDAWPDATRVAFLAALADVCPGDLSVSLLGLSGSDAIDAAVKTAALATGRAGVLTFDGGYHGLALGVLGLQGYKDAFSAPFRALLPPGRVRLPFGADRDAVRATLAGNNIGLVLTEPVLGRGGMIPAPPGWLAMLREEAHAAGALFALDEIQSGLGRTGRWFACQHDDVVPDLMCVGKSLAGGFPLSACVGTPEVMRAWGASTGEALHTQTFLGHPVGCAAGLATLSRIADGELPRWAEVRGAQLREGLTSLGLTVRGRGLMLGVHLPQSPLAVARRLLRRGYLVLPAGQQGEVLGLTPPVCLSQAQIDGFVSALSSVLAEAT